jgi:preprotein translocase subunit SecF
VTYASVKPIAAVRADVERAGYPDAEIQAFAGTTSYAIRLKGDSTLDAQSVEHILTTLQAADPANTVRIDRKEYVGPAVGARLKQQAILAIGFAIAAIVTYVAFRFANPLWGAAGIVALAHDVLATLGLLSITQIEVDLVVMGAILTIAGYSINDTIVIFDRMRERLRTPKNTEPLDASIDASINETLSRTLLTNGTVLAVVLTLFFFGGQVIHDFAFVMVVGGLVGTYSTIAIATPLIYERHVRARASEARAT